MSISSSLDVYFLTSAADQLTVACRASFCIAAPMVQVSGQRTAIMAPGIGRATLIEVTRGTNLNAVVNLPINVDLGGAAAFCLQHVFSANLTNCAHTRASSLLEKFFSAAIFVNVIVPEPAVVLHGGQVEARIARVLLVLDNDCFAFVIRTTAGQVFSFDQFLEFFVVHVLHLFLIVAGVQRMTIYALNGVEVKLYSGCQAMQGIQGVAALFRIHQ